MTTRNYDILIRIKDAGSKAISNVRGELTRLDKASRSFNPTLGDMVKRGLAFGAAFMGAQKAMQLFSGAIRKGFKSVEDYRINLASLSALTLTFMEQSQGADLASMWQEANSYAKGLIPTVEQISAQTLLSGQQANQLVTEFTKAGQAIDTTNEKQVQGLKNIANALFVVTGGRDLDKQIITEISALMRGHITANDKLGKLLLAQNKDLKDNLKTWRSQGVVIEKLGEMLYGFTPAAKDLASTWTAVSSTLDTIVNRILRGGMAPIYEEIIASLKDMGEFLLEHADVIQNEIYKTWLSFKGLIEGVKKLLEAYGPVLSIIVKGLGMIIEGWRLIFTILPPIIDRVAAIPSFIWQSVKAAGNLYKILYQVMTLQFDEAKETLKDLTKNLAEAGKQSGKFFAEGFKEQITARLDEYYAALDKGDKKKKELEKTAKVPKLITPEIEKKEKVDTKARDQRLKLEQDLKEAILQIRTEISTTEAQRVEAELALMDYRNQQALEKYSTFVSDKEQLTEYESLLEEKKLKFIEDVEKKYEDEKLARQDAIAAVIAGVKGRIAENSIISLQDQQNRELEVMRQKHDEEKKEIIKHGADKMQILELQAQQEMELETKKKQHALAMWQARLNMAEQVVDGMAEVLQTLSSVSGKENKKLFMMGKAIAIAQATINVAQAVTKALAQGGIFGTVQAAIIAATGGLQVAKIASMQPQGYAKGGPVKEGSGGKDDVPAMLMRDEFIQPVSAVRHYGVQIMEALRRKIIPREIFSSLNLPKLRVNTPSYAFSAGGLASPANAETGGIGAGQSGQEKPFNIVNIVDNKMMDEYMASSSGERAVINIINRNPNPVKRALSM